MGAIRDAARTRKRIVQAARQEFAQRGFAGARIDAIAKRAKIKKQLLYHYYASKAALFDEIVQQAIELREDLAMADEAPGAIFRQRFLTALNDPTWVRFVTWEALDYPRSRRIARQDRRQVALRNQRNAIIAKQFHGTLPKSVRAELLQLALYALATYPLAYAPITRMVTGKLPSDPKFQQEWMAFLDQLGALLAAADANG